MPKLTEVEWAIKPLLEEWAEVASYDAPGVGDEPGEPTIESIADRGLQELDRRGWGHCVVVGDELGAPAAVAVAMARPRAVEGLALGHACLEYTRKGERPSVHPEVASAYEQLLEVDFRTFVRHDFSRWDPEPTHDPDLLGADALADEYVRRVRPEVAAAFYGQLFATEDTPRATMRDPVRRLGVSLLLVEHEGCLVFTREGYEDAVAAFPDAATASTPVSPSMSPDFADALRKFCAGLPVSDG